MQIIEERKIASNVSELLFTDNEVINGKVWLLDKYNHYPEWIENEITENHYDLYLLTYPDIDFVSDNVRENENRRMYFYEWYKSELDKYKFNYQIIKGLNEIRFANALSAVESFLKSIE